MLAYAGVCWRMLTYADVIAGEEAYMHDLRLEGQQRARTIPIDMPAAAAAACNDWREVLSLLALLVQQYKY
jgi:hypothetical protein